MNIAIVSGASSGMGKEFVKQIAQNYALDEIWVIARRENRLVELQNLVNVKIKAVPLDLTNRQNIEQLASLLKECNPTVSVLVNGSGFGKFGSFVEIPLLEQYDMIDLNATALMGITHCVLPFMAKGSEIYQIDSLSSFQPVPFISVYAATKSFVLSFSRSLNVELKKSGIKVMAVCPGWVKTEFFSRAMKDDTISYFNKYFEACDVVCKAIKDMKKGKDVSVCGASIRWQVRLTKLLPHRLVMKIWCHQQKK